MEQEGAGLWTKTEALHRHPHPPPTSPSSPYKPLASQGMATRDRWHLHSRPTTARLHHRHTTLPPIRSPNHPLLQMATDCWHLHSHQPWCLSSFATPLSDSYYLPHTATFTVRSAPLHSPTSYATPLRSPHIMPPPHLTSPPPRPASGKRPCWRHHLPVCFFLGMGHSFTERH